MISAVCFSAAPVAPRPITTRRTSRRTAPIRSSPNDSMSIQEYIEEHALGKKVEDVINAAVKAKAAEPVSFMVRALPAISFIREAPKRRLQGGRLEPAGCWIRDRIRSGLHHRTFGSVEYPSKLSRDDRLVGRAPRRARTPDGPADDRNYFRRCASPRRKDRIGLAKIAANALAPVSRPVRPSAG